MQPLPPTPPSYASTAVEDAAIPSALAVAASGGTDAADAPSTSDAEDAPDTPVLAAVPSYVREDVLLGTYLGQFAVPGMSDIYLTFAGPPDGAGYRVTANGLVRLTAPLDHEAARTFAVSATAAYNTASGPGARSPTGTGALAVADVYEPGDPGQSAPPAPVAVNNGVAFVGGTSAGFRAERGDLAFASEDDAGVAFIPGVDRALFADGALSFAADTPEAFLQRLSSACSGAGRTAAATAVEIIFRDALERGADAGALAALVPVYEARGAAAVLLAVTASAEFASVEHYRASGEYLFD